jgi:hypothetical protein
VIPSHLDLVVAPAPIVLLVYTLLRLLKIDFELINELLGRSASREGSSSSNDELVYHEGAFESSVVALPRTAHKPVDEVDEVDKIARRPAIVTPSD